MSDEHYCMVEYIPRRVIADLLNHNDFLRGSLRYQFGAFENVSICGSSTYPCGSVAGTPGYMCASELLRLYELA